MIAATLLLSASLASAAPAGAPAQDALVLKRDQPQTLELDAAWEVGAVVRLRVPQAAVGAVLTITDAPVDVDIYARYGAPPDLEEILWDTESAGPWLDERLVLSRADQLYPGDWYFRVVPAYGAALDSMETIRCTATATLVEPTASATELGVVRTVTLDPARGLWAVYSLAVPAGSAPRVEVASDADDVDLVVSRFPNGRRFEEPLASAHSMRAFERLRIAPDPSDRTLYLHVYSYPVPGQREPVLARLLAVDGADAATVAPAPRIPAAPAATPLERAIHSTINILSSSGGGSGVVVSPEGWVLTNAHVVVGTESELGPDGLPAIAAGFTVDPTRPALCTLGLSLVEVRTDLDLALLRITRRIDGRRLDPLPTFPFVPLRAGSEGPPRPALGTPLWVLGYPLTGGSASLQTITLSKGILSGFAREPEGLSYKTDAAVHSGVSGGACVDAEGRLVGLPAASISDVNAAGGLGYVLPVELLPGEWRERIER